MSAVSYTGRVGTMHLSDGKPHSCGSCDECCPCCDVGTAIPAGIYLTIHLDDPDARVRFGTVTVTYDPTPERSPS